MKKSRFSFLVLISVVLMLALAAPAQAVSPGLPNVVVQDVPDGAVLWYVFSPSHIYYNSSDGYYYVEDLSPYGNDGKLVDANTTNADGDTPPQLVQEPDGTWALSFDGTDDYVETDTITTFDVVNESYTFVARVKPEYNQNSLAYHIVGRYPKIGITLKSISSTHWEFSGWLNGYWNGKGYITFNEEHSVAVIYYSNTTTRDIYADSNYVGSDATGSLSSWTTTVRIGYDPYFTGYSTATKANISEVMILNRSADSNEIRLYSALTGPHKFSSQPTVIQTNVPTIDITRDQTVLADLEEFTTETNAYLPIPVAAKNVNPANWVFTVNGDILQIDDNRYVNASSVNVSIPLRVESHVVQDLPDELVLDEDRSYTYVRQVAIYNPSDVSVLASLSVPATLGFADLRLNGAAMGRIGDSFVSSALLSPGETKVLNLTAIVPLARQEVEFPATFDDFLSIRSFNSSEAFLESAIQGKLETRAKVVRIDASNLGNRSVVLPLGVKVKDVIEAQALTGSKELLTVREGKDGKAEVVVPASAFEGDEFAKTAEVKILYNRKPSLLERLGLASLASLIEKIKSILGGG